MEPIYLVVFYDEEANYHFEKVSRIDLIERLNINYYGDINIKFVNNHADFDTNWDLLIMPWNPIIPKVTKATKVATKWNI